MKPARRQKHSGFTLAELLIASTLLSIVMASVYTLFHSAVGSWRAVERDFDAYLDARSAINLISREVNNIVWQAGHLFEGEDDEFTMFTAVEPMNVEEAEGRHLLRIRYYHNKSKKTLVREEALVEMALPNEPPKGFELDRARIKVKKEEKFVVASNVRDFQIRYLWTPIPERRNPNDPPVPIEHIIVDKHRERLGLPQGIELKLVFTDPRYKKTDLTVRTRLAMHVPNRRYTKKILLGELEGLP